MKNYLIALALILVAGLTAPAHAATGEGALVETALTNLMPELTKAEEAGWVLDDGTSVVGLYVAPGKTAEFNRVWRRPDDKFRVAVGKTTGNAEVNGEATIAGSLTGFEATMDAAENRDKGFTTEETETGKARWKFTLKNTGKKPIYFLVALLRETTPNIYEVSALETVMAPIIAEVESSPRKLSLNTHSIICSISAPKIPWIWSVNLKKDMKLFLANDKGSEDVTIAVIAKDKSVVVAPTSENLDGITLDADVPGGSVQILNTGAEPVFMAFLYR